MLVLFAVIVVDVRGDDAVPHHLEAFRDPLCHVRVAGIEAEFQIAKMRLAGSAGTATSGEPNSLGRVFEGDGDAALLGEDGEMLERIEGAVDGAGVHRFVAVAQMLHQEAERECARRLRGRASLRRRHPRGECARDRRWRWAPRSRVPAHSSRSVGECSEWRVEAAVLHGRGKFAHGLDGPIGEVYRRAKHLDALDARAGDLCKHGGRERLLDVSVGGKNTLHASPRARTNMVDGNRLGVNSAIAATVSFRSSPDLSDILHARAPMAIFHSKIGGSMNLKNAVALITGGSSGIGRAIGQMLAASGSRVAITGRNEKRLQEAARELGVHAIHADVSVEADVERTYRELFQKFGDLDIVVNNAGVGVFKNLVDMGRGEFESVFATNVTGAMLMAREAARHFVKKKSGNIVNISSTAGLRGAPNGTAYYASKFALRGMTECWRGELRKHNIRVILVNPSEVVTNFFQTANLPQNVNETKLRGEEIAFAVKAALEMDDRGFMPELSVFATNPKD